MKFIICVIILSLFLSECYSYDNYDNYNKIKVRSKLKKLHEQHLHKQISDMDISIPTKSFEQLEYSNDSNTVVRELDDTFTDTFDDTSKPRFKALENSSGTSEALKIIFGLVVLAVIIFALYSLWKNPAVRLFIRSQT